MCTAQVNAPVRLTRGVPTLWLDRGDVGVIRSVWNFSNVYYEVEVRKPGEPFAVRALLSADQIEVIAPPPSPRRAFVNGEGQQP